MIEDRNVFISYEIYSDVFSYPNESLRKKVKNIQESLNVNYPEAARIFSIY